MWFQRFTVAQRAMTLAGMAPLALVGCVAADRPDFAVQTPAPTYRVAMPVPPPPPPPPPAPTAPAALVTRINALADHFRGKVGIAVKHVQDGWMVSKNGDTLMPQQSVSKLWVAMTVLAYRDAGRLTLDDPITVTEDDLTLFHQPIASLVKGDGYDTTVRELLRRSMTMSDNTANDRLLQYVGGPEAVRGFLARNNLGNIRFGPGERLLQSRTAGLEWKQDYAMGRAFQKARAQLPKSVRLAAFNSYIADPPDGAGAAAIVNALARLKRGELLSAGSTAWLIDAMQDSRTGKQRLRGAVPDGWMFGHKTGTGQDLLGRTAGYNDVGILTAPDGESYAVAVLIGDTPLRIPQRQELMQSVVEAVVASHD